MRSKKILQCFTILCLAIGAGEGKKLAKTNRPPSLWVEPHDIAGRDLYYGQGGRDHAPTAAPFTFVEEDSDGNSPKFVVKDANGVKWKVKVGPEARPETVVTRLVWAVGYATDEDYFVPAQRVEKMPAKLKRGAKFVDSDGIVHDARWERMDHTKLGNWKWSKNPFSKSRELSGLRVLMALVNNYDMKTGQNSIYAKGDRQQYVVSDLGATMGPTGTKWPLPTKRGDLDVYRDADFIKKVEKDYVDFASPSWPMLFGVLPMPPLPYSLVMAPFTYIGGPKVTNVASQRWIGKRVPREDVRWMAGLLRKLSPKQIRSAFRAAHYTPEEVEGFSRAVEARIAALNEL